MEKIRGRATCPKGICLTMVIVSIHLCVCMAAVPPCYPGRRRSVWSYIKTQSHPMWWRNVESGVLQTNHDTWSMIARTSTMGGQEWYTSGNPTLGGMSPITTHFLFLSPSYLSQRTNPLSLMVGTVCWGFIWKRWEGRETNHWYLGKCFAKCKLCMTFAKQISSCEKIFP